MFAEVLFRYVGGEFDLTGWGLCIAFVAVFMALVWGRWGRDQ